MFSDLKKLILITCAFTVAAQNVENSKLVTISQGSIRGYRNAEHDIYEFFGIPYATAPTGIQRFKAPLPPPTWTQILEAVDNGIICPQNPSFGFVPFKQMQEDCLIANIHVPNTEETNLPVLVMVHGGAYALGFGHMWAPRRIAGTKKVITVSFNYRLGAHGFLCLGTPEAPGNAGMKDQVALLRWVRDNIANFGGNPNDVTISGNSAGSSSVELLMIAKPAQGLFNKVIPESGSNVASWSAHTDPIKSAKEYARLLNFGNVDDLNALEEFYKTLPYDTLNSAYEINQYNGNLYFSPCIENNLGEEMFLDDSPVNIIKSERFRKVPLLYGFTDMEGLLRIGQYDDWFDAMNEHFSEFLPDDLEFENEDEKERVAQSVKEFYFGSSRVGIRTIFGYIYYFTDAIFAYPMLRSAKLQVETGHDSIYLYHFTFYKQFPSVPGVPDALTNKPGADHCDQSYAVLDPTLGPVPEENYTEEYRQLRAIMVEFWVNFITTG
ncbi:hypothetical protein MSG28_009801 [Choristoneura fumiferana]|uniref:Uncharacterized protein n=2 Tax=Choristoneura fumiferana TaxID=7141 RepID=A0ACC0JCQ5_CHOFU|nr:hypothetical protein MSG28_009801 [Choristoneura fumiferana]